MRIRKTTRKNRKNLFLEPLERREMLSAYSVVDLGFLPESCTNEWNDINNAGQVVGSSGQYAWSGQNAALWNPSSSGDGTGTLIDLGKLPGDDRAAGEAISSNGWVAGFSLKLPTPENPPLLRPFVWIPETSNGTTGTMLAIGDGEGRAMGVNNQGKVVGVLGDYDFGQAFVWERDASGDHLTDLNDVLPREQLVAQGLESGVVLYEAPAINDSNQIVVNGSYQEDTDGDGSFDVNKGYAFLLEDDNGSFYDGGDVTITYLGSLGGTTWATDINNNGQIVGSGWGSSPWGSAFLWEDGVMTDLGTLPREWLSRAEGISDNGTIVGYSGTYSYDAVIWQNGRLTNLNKMLPRNSGWSLDEARAVNNDGQIVGTGSAPHTAEHVDGRGYLLSTSVAVPMLSIGDAAVIEGDLDVGGSPELTPVELEVTLSEPATEALTVDFYTAAWYDESIADEDFVSGSGSVTFQPGETSQTITVHVLGDVLAGGATHDQGDEFFTVSLIDPRNAAGEQTAVFHDAQGTVTILEDEPALSIADAEIAEGNEGLRDLTFTVTVENADSEKDDIVVYWHTENNTARDYGDPADGDPDYISVPEDNPAMLVIPAGASSATFSVSICGDTVVESNDVLRVQLHTDTVENATILVTKNGAAGLAYGIIVNDDGGGGGKGGGKGKNKLTASSSGAAEAVKLLDESQVEPLLVAAGKPQAVTSEPWTAASTTATQDPATVDTQFIEQHTAPVDDTASDEPVSSASADEAITDLDLDLLGDGLLEVLALGLL